MDRLRMGRTHDRRGLVWRAGALSALAAALLASTPPATAHPHVWVTYEMTINYDKGAVTGVDHIWTFDDMYTAMAVEGLDKNNDGKYDRQELAELAKVNMDGLKDFDYFTYAKLGSADLKFLPPVEPWLEYTNGVLHLHFHLPLAQPVLADAQGLTISVYDPSFFIAFEPEKTDAVKLVSAPAGCTAALVDPDADKNAADAKRLGDAFAQQLGGVAAGLGSFRTVAVKCQKS